MSEVQEAVPIETVRRPTAPAVEVHELRKEFRIHPYPR